jgi:hypothetical protein
LKFTAQTGGFDGQFGVNITPMDGPMPGGKNGVSEKMGE